MNTSLASVIVSHPFFEGMKPEHLEVIAGCATEATFESDQILFREGELPTNSISFKVGGLPWRYTSLRIGPCPSRILAPATCSAGHGCFRRSSGTCRRALWNPLERSSWTALIS